jgi:hypothetical protein
MFPSSDVVGTSSVNTCTVVQDAGMESCTAVEDAGMEWKV